MESSIKRLDSTGGRDVRTIEVTTLIQGVPTVVEMQVIALSDGRGNVIDTFATYNLQVEQLQVMRELVRVLAHQAGIAVFLPGG
jgi:hypothetical protein